MSDVDKYTRWYDETYPDISSKELEKARRYIEISKHELDDNIEQQPVILDLVSDKSAFATSIKDHRKDSLDSVVNDKAAHYRQSLSRDSKTKPTDKSIYEAVYNDKRYKAALQKFNTCKLMAARWGSLKSSFEQRSSMLKTLAQLYSANYFTVSSTKDADKGNREAKASGNRKAIHRKRMGDK